MTDPDPDRIALARRLVACPRWEWRPGMLALVTDDVGTGRVRIVEGATADDPPWGDDDDDGKWTIIPTDGAIPDLDDPGTLGCLLALVREIAPDCPVEVCYHPDADSGDGSGWSVVVGDRHTYGTLGAALVAALEAEP